MIRNSLRAPLAVALAALAGGVAAAPASADDFTWVHGNQGGNSNWSNPQHWTGGIAPSGAVGAITFPAAPATPTGQSTLVTDDVLGLSASTLDVQGPQVLAGTADKPLTLTSGVTADGATQANSVHLRVPLALSGPNTWTVTRGGLSVEGGVSGTAPLDVHLASTDYATASRIEFFGTGNEVGPVTITGATRTTNGGLVDEVSLRGPLTGTPADGEAGGLNGTNGNPVVLKDLSLTGIGQLGALSTSDTAISVKTTEITPSTKRTLQVASATFDPRTVIQVAVNPMDPTPGTASAQITSPGPIDLGGAALMLTFTTHECPSLGTTYTVVTTTGALSGSLASDRFPIQCGANEILSYRLQANRTGSPQTVTATVEPKLGLPSNGLKPVGAPLVSGAPTVGQTLTATHGKWSPAATRYTDQWLRCATASSASCTEISGANALRYTVTSADLGKRLQLREGFTEAQPPGGPSQFSAMTAVVTAGASAAQVTAALKKIGAPPSNASVRSVLAKGATLTFSAPSAGTLSVAWYGAGARVIAKGTRTVTKSGKVKIVVKPTSAGRRLLKQARRSLKLTSKASFTPKGGKRVSRTASFKLKH